MLSAEPCVPVDFRVVESEETILLSDFYVHVIRTGEDFISEGSKFILLPYVVNLVYDSADGRVFIQENGGYEEFVGKILLAKIEVG